MVLISVFSSLSTSIVSHIVARIHALLNIYIFATATIRPIRSEILETMVTRASEERKKLVHNSCERMRADCIVRNDWVGCAERRD